MRNNIVKNSSNTAKLSFQTHCKSIINDVEIIACKLELFQNLIIDYKSRDQRRKGEINNVTSAIVSAP
jgi:hypothetical protein